jgi:hypothetical protein
VVHTPSVSYLVCFFLVCEFHSSRSPVPLVILFVFSKLLTCLRASSEWIRAIGRAIVMVKTKKFVNDDGSEDTGDD